MGCRLVAVLLLLAAGLVHGVEKKRTLVLLDNNYIQESHSVFLKHLRDQGHELVVKTADDASLSLVKFGEYTYDNLVLFSPSVEEFGGALNVQAISQFVDSGRNLLIAASSSIGEPFRELGRELGFEFDEQGTAVIDHFNYETKDEGTHSLLVVPSSNTISAPKIVSKKIDSPFLYKGVGLVADPENSLVLEILSGSTTTYSYFPDQSLKEYPHAVGKSTVLIGGLQARNNARVVISGSLDFFSDKFFASSVQNAGAADSRKYAVSGNRALAEELSAWVFKQQGVLRVSSVDHQLVGGSSQSVYTVEEEVIYRIKIEEFVGGQWVPYIADDVQLDLHRIDPFIRRLLNSSSSGVFSTQMVLPDVYGVFQFKVAYDRIGYTYLQSSVQVVVRPKTHVQYERFIFSAYPYYISTFSMMIGVWLLTVVFLHNRDDSKVKGE